MGFDVEINSILRSDDPFVLQKGQVCDFTKSGSRVFFDNIPIWLTRSDWTALAEILVVEQTRTTGSVKGRFRIQHVYDGVESPALTAVFRRMYAPGGDPNIYVLLGGADFVRARDAGTLYEPTLQTVGFIHASPLDQLSRVANKYYATVVDVQVVVVALDRIDAPVKWEPATGGLYPHIYGPMNMDAVVKVVPVKPGADGSFQIDRATIYP